MDAGLILIRKRSTRAQAGCLQGRSPSSWHPAIPLEKTLSWIVDWYKAFEAGPICGKSLFSRFDYETLLPDVIEPPEPANPSPWRNIAIK